MVIFNWWEALPIMKGGWRCASIIPGEQCVMIFGVVLMLLWSAGSWDMPTLDVSLPYCCTSYRWNKSDVVSQWSDAGISCRQLDYHRMCTPEMSLRYCLIIKSIVSHAIFSTQATCASAI